MQEQFAAKLREYPSLDLHERSWAVSIFASYSFSSGVVKRSEFTSVCLRS